MTRQTLIWKIINRLHEEDTLDVNNYVNYIEQANDIYKVIERCLDDYEIVEGKVIK